MNNEEKTITESPIQHYLKNSNANATSNKDIKFYFDRLFYYRNLLDSTISAEKKYFCGYGEIEFEIDQQGVQDIYDFWFNTMTWFIETEAIRKYKNKKN